MEDKYGIVPPVKIEVVTPGPERTFPPVPDPAKPSLKKHPLTQHEHPDAHGSLGKAWRTDIRREAGQVVAPRESKRKERGNQPRSHLAEKTQGPG